MSDDEDRRPWDADDARRREDCFAPPAEPCECTCLHCHRVFSSDGIWLQRLVDGRDGFEGFWRCPTNNCGGAGFTFDLFPTDPDHPANAGWHDADDDGPAEFDDDGEFVPPADREWSTDEGDDDEEDDDDAADAWKVGLTPEQAEAREAERRAAWAEWEARAAAEESERQADFDRPDRRPRVVDARDDLSPPSGSDDDVPF